MKKLRFKTRKSANNGNILYFGIGGRFISSGFKDTKVNRNIIIGRFKRGELDTELNFESNQDTKTIEELLDEVMITKSKVLKHQTISSYRMTIKNWIIPYFKNTLVTEVKPLQIKRFQDMMMDKGIGKSGINISRGLLKEVFILAIIEGWIVTNPITIMPSPKIKSRKAKQKPCTLDEIDLILNHSKGEVKNFIGISFFTGMRSGELLALKWDDVDFNTDTITITNTISRGYINSVKTDSSERDIEMIDQARIYFKQQQLLTGLQNTYVFLNSKNLYYGTNTNFYTKFRKTLQELNLEMRSLHNTRHTFASIMLNNGIDTFWVSNTLGHSDTTITLNTYAHFIPRKEKMMLGFLDKRYKKQISS